MGEDRVPELAGRIRSLQDEPLAEHADVLEDVQQAIVAELDAIGGWQRSTGSPSRS